MAAPVSQQIQHLLDGVSQRPSAIRLPSQGAEQINGLSLWGKALMKRPPIIATAALNTDTTGMEKAFIHTINRDGKTRYIVVIANGDLNVYDANTGAEKTVDFTSGKAYLADTKGFRAVTVGDYTFIVNRDTTVLRDSGTTVTARPPEALVFVRQADYSTDYTVTVDGNVFTHTTTNATAPADRAGITSEAIAAALKTLIDATLSATHTVTRTGSSLYIKRINNADFTITATDGVNDNAILAIKGTVQRFDDLPLYALDGFIVEVTGDPGNEYDNYWVVFDDAGAPTGRGVWRETLKPGENYEWNLATMPWVLTDDRDGTFTFDKGAWRDREVGSLTTNPYPSFENKEIKDVFFHKGRLGFVSEENIILSGAADVFNFFRQSAKQLNDSDLIDIQAAFARVTEWHTFTEWNNEALFWAENAQVLLRSGEGALSPKTAELVLLSGYENQADCKPIVLGERIFFAQIIAGKSRISEYVWDQQLDKPRAIDCSVDVPQYVTGDPVQMAGTDVPGFLAVLTKDKSKLYVYSYAHENSLKVQSSWSKWTFGVGRCLGIEYLAGSLRLVMLQSTGVYLEEIRIGDITTEQLSAQVAEGYIGSTSMGILGEVNWSITPWVDATGNAEGGTFESAASLHSGQSNEQNIYFDKDVTQVIVQIFGSDFADSVANFFDAKGNSLGTLTFPASDDSQRFSAQGIRRVQLVPHVGGAEYVAWSVYVTVAPQHPVFLDHQKRFTQTIAQTFTDTFTDTDGVLLNAHQADLPDTDETYDATVTKAFLDLLYATASTAVAGDGSAFEIQSNKAQAVSAIQALTGAGMPAAGGATIMAGSEIYMDLTRGSATLVSETGTMGYFFGSNFSDEGFAVQIINGTDFNTSVKLTHVSSAGSKSITSSPVVIATGSGKRIGVTLKSGNLVDLWHEPIGGGSRTYLATDNATLSNPWDLDLAGCGIFVETTVSTTDATWDNFAIVGQAGTLGTGSTATAGTMTLPFAVATDGSEGEVVVFRLDTLEEVTCTRPSATTVAVTDDLTGTDVMVGLRYTFEYTLSDLFIRNGEGKAETAGRTQIRYLTVLLQDTADLTATVTPDGRSAYTYTYAANPALDFARWLVPVMAQNYTVGIVLSNDKSLGCSIAGLDWEGTFATRARRI